MVFLRRVGAEVPRRWRDRFDFLNLAAALSPDGAAAAIVLDDRIVVWDVDRGEQRSLERKSAQAIASVASGRNAYGTLAVNLIGSFLLAGLMFAGVEAATMSPTVRLALTTGVMGGFTTYSTFSYETMKYLQDGAWGIAIANVLITVVGCLVACLLGWVGAKWLFGT